MDKKIPPQFNLATQPSADTRSMVVVDNARFTILTSRLIRMEYSPDGIFEDRPSQIFWYRRQPVPEYEFNKVGDLLEISTPYLSLHYKVGEPFGEAALSIELAGTETSWHFGDHDSGNLGGTARTLDTINGQIPLEPGLISSLGWTLVDDSGSPVFDSQGWLTPRLCHTDALDLYFLGYGHDYQACMNDFYHLSGPVPLLPRWSLGNWWSRYWAYSQDELIQLMRDFQSHQIPLSVCIIDMDWHLTQTGNQSSGWTGYTWNRDLFPDPPGFLHALSELGLKKSLNLHPAEGIHPHEAMYAQLANALGLDPKASKPIQFDPEDPGFVEAYFEILHHPQESQGVDFWWLDWQQGNPVRMPGLNLLWWINHLHFHDLARQEQKRPFIFSRWGGLGNHRYPIGFSGDTFSTWDSLAFQPYFTATAANVGYGWWSHDIGGHMGGVEDQELYTRWVQFGVFSPILRLHSTNNPFHERRPWGFDAEIQRIAQQAMQLRHALIPYLYSMSWQNYRHGVSPIRPMYYLHPEDEQSYACPNQYTFGSELIAAPFIKPRDEHTQLSRQVIWLPAGDWFNFFTGHRLPGDSWQALYGSLDEIPVFARSGAIVPLGELPAWGGIGNPETLNVHIYPGDSNRFELYEDDGESRDYLHGDYAITPISQDWSSDRQVFQIRPAQGKTGSLPAQRSYSLTFHALQNPDLVSISLNGHDHPVNWHYNPDLEMVVVPAIEISPTDSLQVDLSRKEGLMAGVANPQLMLHSLLQSFRLDSFAKQSIDRMSAEIIENPLLLLNYTTRLTQSQMLALLETLLEGGVEHISNAGEERIILWNNHQNPLITYTLSQELLPEYAPRQRFRSDRGVLPVFKQFLPAQDFKNSITSLRVDYRDLLTLTITQGQVTQA